MTLCYCQYNARTKGDVMTILRCLLLSAAVLVFALPARQAAAAGPIAAVTALRIGFVDTETVLQGSLEFKEVDREARTKVDLKEEEGQKKLEEIRKLEEELSVMSEEQRRTRLSEYNRKRQDLVDFQTQTREEILERQGVDLKRIAAKIKRIIETVGASEHMTVIFDTKPVLYIDAAQVVDLTDRVTQTLNAEYAKEKEKLRLKMPTRVQ